MTTPAMRPLLVAPDTEVEPLLRAARSTVARLSLQVRTARYEVEQAELGDDEDRRAAEAVLRTSLDELVAARAAALAADLERELAAAAAVVDAARDEAAAVVGRERAVRFLVDDRPPPPEVPPSAAPFDDVAPAVVPDAPVRPLLLPPPPLGDAASATSPPPPLDDAAWAPPVAPAPVAEPRSALAGISTPDDLARIIQAAVDASVAGVLAATTAVPVVAPVLVPVPAAAASRPPVLRRFLHLDVVLPLIAVLLVAIVLLAWVG